MRGRRTCQMGTDLLTFREGLGGEVDRLQARLKGHKSTKMSIKAVNKQAGIRLTVQCYFAVVDGDDDVLLCHFALMWSIDGR